MCMVTTSDGVRIAVYDPNPCGSPTVLLVHGWPLSHEIFEYQVNRLLARGYRAVTLDLRGFGRSDAPAGGYDYDRLARDVYEVVRCRKLAPFALAGFSMGGAIALRYMRLFGGYGVCKLLLLAAAAPSFTQRSGFPYGQTREAVNQLIRQASTDRAQLSVDFSHQIFAREHSDAIVRWFEQIALSASGHATIETALSLRDEDGRADLACVHVPTAIFQADKDQIVLRGLTQYQYAHIPGAVLYTFADSGHGIVYDQLEEFNARFFAFLDR